MTTITVSPKLIKEKELVIIPRKEYEGLLRAAKKRPYTQLDRDLEEAMAEYKAGKCIGPFSSVKELKKSLEK